MGEKGNAQSDTGVKIEEPPRTQERPGTQDVNGFWERDPGARPKPDPQTARRPPLRQDDPESYHGWGPMADRWGAEGQDESEVQAWVDSVLKEEGNLFGSPERAERFMSRYRAARAKRGH